MKSKIRIGLGQGFYGDLQRAPIDQVTKGPIDYLVMDFLAEVTMSILQKQKIKNRDKGYAVDLVTIMEEILPVCMEKNIRVISNGGGVNPYACAEEILNISRKIGINDLKIGIVSGDDILTDIDKYISSGIEFRNMETGEDISLVKDKLTSANVYFGAEPIVNALEKGAQIIITGRTTDTGLTLAPMIYEFGWRYNEWDKLASGTVAGHIMECGGQVTGGNFMGGWKNVPNLAEIGFPITEAYPDGTFTVTKHENSGGLVNTQTVKEQLLYEIGDPKNYITPEAITDFTTIVLTDESRNHVKVSGIKGKPATENYKVSMSFHEGYTAVGQLTYTWPDALEKAKNAESILRKRLQNLGLEYEEIRTEFVGLNGCHSEVAPMPDIINEVVLRIGVRSANYKSVEHFGKEIAPLILTGPPSVTGFAGGRPKPSEVITFWPALIPKTAIKPEVSIK